MVHGALVLVHWCMVHWRIGASAWADAAPVVTTASESALALITAMFVSDCCTITAVSASTCNASPFSFAVLSAWLGSGLGLGLGLGLGVGVGCGCGCGCGFGFGFGLGLGLVLGLG